MIPHRWLLALLGFTLLVAIGCGDPFADQFTHARITEADVVGTYDVSSWYGTATSTANGALCRIDLREKGQGTITHCARGTDPGSVVEAAWRLEKCQSDEDWTCVRIDAPGDGSFPVNLTGERPPFDLLITVGDPDEGDAYRLKRAIKPMP